MHRFYSEHANFSLKRISIDDSHEVHHIKDVLRLKKGAQVQIFNGRNQEADVVLEEITDGKITASIQGVREMATAEGSITLACAPPKKGKFELIIEKCTELGADVIIPLKTKRGEVVFSSDRMASKLNRFESVAINAAKQSKHVRVPKVLEMQTLSQVLKNLDGNGIHVFPSLHGHSKHIQDVLLEAKGKNITIFIGPEGDFTPDEVDLAVKAGCVPVSLGRSVLKVETAAIAAVALARFLTRD